MIKMSKIGKAKKPILRIIVIDKHKDPWGRFIENVGNYNPRTKEFTGNPARIKDLLSKGAQPSDSLYNLLITQGIIEGKKLPVSRISKKRRERMEKEKKSA